MERSDKEEKLQSRRYREKVLSIKFAELLSDSGILSILDKWLIYQSYHYHLTKSSLLFLFPFLTIFLPLNLHPSFSILSKKTLVFNIGIQGSIDLSSSFWSCNLSKNTRSPVDVNRSNNNDNNDNRDINWQSMLIVKIKRLNPDYIKKICIVTENETSKAQIPKMFDVRWY